MNDGSLSFVLETDRSRVWHTLVSAFFDDPVERWLYPGDSEYLSQFPRLLDAFGGDAFNKQTVWSLDDSAAVAVWFPPDADLDGDAVVAVLTQTVRPSKHQDALVVLDQMASAHPPGLYWYLPWLGVRRSRQGQGLGGQLLKRCLQRVDADHLPAYLDTPNPRNLSLYQRCGFEIVKVAQAGECPPVTCMLRPAQ